MRNRDPLCDNDVPFFFFFFFFFLAKNKREKDISDSFKCKFFNQACGNYKPFKQEDVIASVIIMHFLLVKLNRLTDVPREVI